MDYQTTYKADGASTCFRQEKERIVMPIVIVIDYRPMGPTYKRLITDTSILLQLNANIRCLLLKMF